MKSLILATSAVVLLGAQSSQAMPNCGDRDAVIAALSGQYSEHHVASGLQSDTGLLEIWASDDRGSWTILMTRPDGQTCVMASGTHWLEQVKAVMPDGDPA